MNRDDEDAYIREMAAHGVRAVRREDFTPQNFLDSVRENRRRYAADERMQALGRLARPLATDLVAETSLAPEDIAAVLISTAARLGGLAVKGAPATVLIEMIGFAADDLDQQANAGEGR